MDFMCDSLYDGRRIRTLNIIDSYNRECLSIEVDTSIPDKRVSRVLDRLIFLRGKPKAIICDNGPEFTSIVMDQWSYQKGIDYYNSERYHSSIALKTPLQFTKEQVKHLTVNQLKVVS